MIDRKKGTAMSIVVVGSIAFDSIKTPFGECEQVLGGAANYFSLAAGFFSSVKLVGVVIMVRNPGLAGEFERVLKVASNLYRCGCRNSVSTLPRRELPRK